MTLPVVAFPNSLTELSGYTLAEQLYLGSRTVVYRAVQTAEQRPVIIKTLRHEYPSFSELVQLRNQYAIARDLPISGIVRPLSLEPLSNGYALVMEDWGGVSLATYIQQKPLELTEILEIALQLADILYELSQYRVIHKDIKPANILIHPESKQVKLIDFSIASLLPKETQEIKNPNVLEGTLAYLAPEQTGRMNRGVDYRADYYALGVTLYQLLTGHVPFVADDLLELVHCHIAKMAPPVHQVNPTIPEMMGSIVTKLMAKNAEDRYQSALGLKHDLEQCLTQWKETGSIDEFKLGHRDVCDRFLIPETLYGREAEVKILLEAFDRAAQGASELMLVAGFSGIGKTAVINEVHKPIIKQRGYFIKGKFDQLNRNVPLSAFAQALRNLIGQLLSESDQQLAQWKTQILSTVGDNGQILIEVIPELEQIIGKQPAATELSGTAAQNRFNSLFQAFIEVFTTPKHPLVIFLDDLQWADSASLQLIKLLMKGHGYLLLLGAYRDNEVSRVHPLILTVESLKEAQKVVHTVALAPLQIEDANRLVADTLHCSIPLAYPLTDLVHRKTQGNPFFITQFLKALHEEGCIVFNCDRSYWECDIAQVTTLALTDDVVAFMVRQLQKLPSKTQQLLKLAACIGNQFDLTTLAIISKQFPTDVATALWQAVQEGLIIPTNQIYQLFQTDGLERTDTQNSVNPTYRFLHDRIQQAAYALIPDAQKQDTHYQIGQLLKARIPSEALESHIFELLSQLNAGATQLVHSEQKQELAYLNLTAGRKAKASAAYEPALKYCHTGIDLLTTNSWDTDYELTLELHENAAESAYLCGRNDLLEQYAANIIKHAKDNFDELNVVEIKIQAYTAQNRLIEALQIAKRSLQDWGVSFPKHISLDTIQQELQETQRFLETFTFEELEMLPEMTEMHSLAAMRLLSSITATAYIADPLLFPLIILRMVQWSLRYGNASVSPYAYACYGILLVNLAKSTEKLEQLGELALKLLEKSSDRVIEARTKLVVASHLYHWKAHLKKSLPLAQESYQIALESGDLEYMGYSVQIICLERYFMGQPLADLEPDIQAYCHTLEKNNQVTALRYCQIYLQAILNLLDSTLTPSALTGEALNEQDLLPLLTEANDGTGLYHFYCNKLVLCYLFGNFKEAMVTAQHARSYENSLAGMFVVPTCYFYESLALLENYAISSPKLAEDLQQIDSNRTALKTWAQSSPCNHQHRFDLVEAEYYRVVNQPYQAMEHYDRAITAAKENGYIQEEALANELAAKFYLSRGRENVAVGYMQDAYYSYARWGAKAKIVDLETRYPNLLASILQQKRSSLSTTETLFTPPAFTTAQGSSTHGSSSGSSSISATLDLATVLKASQTLSSDIELDKLLATLLRTVLEAAGADKGVLLMPREDELFVEAIATINQPARVESILLSDSLELPHPLINIVKRSLQPSVIMDVDAHPALTTDVYVAQHHPKSLLCTPILQRGKLIAILYLENQVTVGAFTHDRIELLNLLCTQAAISLENAWLYQQEQEKSIRLEESEKRLQLLLQQTPVAVLEWNQAFECQFWNPAAEKIFGYQAAEMMGRHLSCLVPEDYHAYVGDVADQILTQQGGSHAINENVVKGGQRITCEWFNAPIFDSQGDVCGGVSMALDISDRKAAEAALVESEHYHRSLFENSSIGLLLCKMDGQLVYANPGFANILGRTVAELPELSYWDITPKKYAEAEQQQLQSLQTIGRYGPYEKEYLHKDGHLIPVRLSGVIVERHGEKFIWSNIEDISDRKAAEKLVYEKNVALERTLDQLQHSQAQVIQAEKMSALGNLIAGVAHEINNPIGFLNGSINNAKDYVQDVFNHLALYQQHHPNAAKPVQENAEEIDLEFLEGDLPKLLDSMEGATQRIKNISVSLRTFSRADTDHKVSANLHDGLDSTLLILKYRLKANERRPAIEVIKDYGDIPTVECFPGQLNQVFMNILANAIDALDEASQNCSFAEIKTNPNRITICTTLEHQQVKISIADNGLGISDEVKARIFDHLFTTKEVGKGTGLGLAIAHQIVVDTHGGSLEVESMEGEGTVFFIQLPL